jgi:hypothetical protein
MWTSLSCSDDAGRIPRYLRLRIYCNNMRGRKGDPGNQLRITLNFSLTSTLDRLRVSRLAPSCQVKLF